MVPIRRAGCGTGIQEDMASLAFDRGPPTRGAVAARGAGSWPAGFVRGRRKRARCLAAAPMPQGSAATVAGPSWPVGYAGGSRRATRLGARQPWRNVHPGGRLKRARGQTRARAEAGSLIKNQPEICACRPVWSWPPVGAGMRCPPVPHSGQAIGAAANPVRFGRAGQLHMNAASCGFLPLMNQPDTLGALHQRNRADFMTYQGGMPSPPPLVGFQREQIRAAALAYRAAMTEGDSDGPAKQRAISAYIAAGGNAETAFKDVTRIIASVASDHGEWFWRPVWERLEREEYAMRKLGWWPPPKPWDERRRVAEAAIARVFGNGAAGGPDVPGAPRQPE